MSKNKADFVNNAETRRQYMSEISHLRQLRKEKRIQLLAMASTSNVIKSTKTSSKPGKDFISVLIKLFTTFYYQHFYRISNCFIYSSTEENEQRTDEGKIAETVSSFERSAI